jgi:hypothetical protein
MLDRTLELVAGPEDPDLPVHDLAHGVANLIDVGTR